MKRKTLILGVLFMAVITAVASYAGYGQICSDATELPVSERFLDMDVANLLGAVSEAINHVEHPQISAYIDENGHAYLPQGAVVVQAEILDANDAGCLEENMKETLNRVGDLAFSLIRDKQLVILVCNPYSDTHYYGYFMLVSRHT